MSSNPRGRGKDQAQAQAQTPGHARSAVTDGDGDKQATFDTTKHTFHTTCTPNTAYQTNLHIT